MPTPTWHRLPPARRAAVQQAAEAEFAARGVSDASMNTICRQAGVSKGSLFQYFTDKADLFAYIAELAGLRIREDMARTAATLPWAQDFCEAVRLLVQAWVRYFYDHPVELALTAAGNLGPDHAARAAVRAVNDAHYLEVLRPLVAQAASTGQLPADADVDALLALLLVLLPHMALAGHVSGLDPLLGSARDQDSAVRAARRLLDLVLAAYGVPPSKLD